jgi:sugar/nucleoside kinase (ribokinase family)
LLEQVEILILNHAEAVQFLQMDAQENCRDMGSILGKLNKLGPRCVTVTAGQQGAYFSNGAHNYLISPVRFKSIDTTGTGDAFGATLVAGLIQQRDELTALKMAAINAGAVTREWGAHQGLMNLEEIEVMLDKAVVEEV